MEHWYTITVTAIRSITELHQLDMHVNGEYKAIGESASQALDLFHSSVPIKVLEDFNITIEQDEDQTIDTINGGSPR